MRYLLPLYSNSYQQIQIRMDNFFAKKGLILGRKKQLKTTNNQQHLLRSNDQISTSLSEVTLQDTKNVEHVSSSYTQIPFQSPKKENTNRSLSTKYHQKSYSAEDNNKMSLHNNSFARLSSSQKQPWAQTSPFCSLKQQNFHFNETNNYELNITQMNPKMHKSFQQKKANTEQQIATRLIYQENEPNKFNKHRYLMHKISEQLGSNQERYNPSPTKQNNIKSIRQIDSQQYKDFSFHCGEKYNQFPIRNNILQSNQFNKQTLKDEISPLTNGRFTDNTKTQNEPKINFFQDDLNHGKDYHKIKQQLQNALSQNQTMFQDHQRYIVQVGETRKQFQKQIASLQEELDTLRKEYQNIHFRIEAVTDKSEDKMKLIKLQNQNNFLSKKTEEQVQRILATEQELSETKLLLHSLHEQINRKQNSLSSRRDELNLQQIKQSLTRYDSHILQLNSSIDKKQSQIQKHKKTIETLESQIRRMNQQTYISSIKQKSNQNNLKNEIDTLKISLANQTQMNGKRISNLQEAYQRRGKQIADKDKFIQQFLLSRAKQLNNSSTDEIMSTLKAYFSFKSPTQ